jgi:xylulokinase
VVFGCMLAAAGAFQWYADKLAAAEHMEAKKSNRSVFDVLVAQAETAPPGCEGLFFLPYVSGERCPHPDPQARGCWIGASLRTDRAAMVRALLEGVTFNMGQILSIMRDDMKIAVKQVRGTGGGMKSELWRSIQANIYNAPLVTTSSEEGGAFGVALLAGVGTGVWPDVESACRATIKVINTQRPDKKLSATYAKHAAVYAKLYPSLKDRFGDLAALG